MSISQARGFVGKRCAITWTDRYGNEFRNVGTVQTTRFVPMYGAYLVTESDEVSLEKVTDIQTVE